MDVLDLLNPSKYYQSTAKSEFRNNAEAFFDQLTAESGLDIEQNKITVNNYNQAKANLSKYLGKSGKAKVLRVFLIILTILFGVASIISLIFGFAGSNTIMIIVGFILLLFVPGLIAFNVLFMNKKIAELQKRVDDFTAQSNNYLTEAFGQMERLNNSYDFGIFPKLTQQTIPLFEMDKNFDPLKYEYLHEKYGFEEEKDTDISSIYTQSGSIVGNPFLLQRNYIVKMRDHTYEGSIVIHWTTTVHTKNGTRTVSHTQTLKAYVTKPEPYYYLDTWLIYGNEAAERLEFSRVPNSASKLDDKSLRRQAMRFQKVLNKKVLEDISDNDETTNFTAMANTEFETLFNALDRNNEGQFRLLFTPIAQKSMIELLRSKEPFGDDFVFLKRNNLNYIKSAHSQTTLYLEDFARYKSHDYQAARATFLQDAEDYFKGIYFDLAPLMCIPLYQQHMSQEYIYEEQYYGNVTSYETEAIANRYDEKVFAPKDASTHCILKSEFRTKKGKGDKVNIHAYAYRAENRVTNISVRGGDGRSHIVPVHWIEYIPVEKVTPIVVQPISSEERYDRIIDKLTSDENLIPNILTGGIYYRRGILSMLLNNEDNYDPDYIDKLLS